MMLRQYLRGLDEDEFQAFALRAGTSTKYLRTHVMGGSRGASLSFKRALVSASEGQVSMLDVLMHYGFTKEELEVA